MPDFDKVTLSYSKVPESEIHERISRSQSLLRRGEFQAALILQLIDRYYFSGTIQDGVLGVEGLELIAIVPVGYPAKEPPIPPREDGRISWIGF